MVKRFGLQTAMVIATSSLTKQEIVLLDHEGTQTMDMEEHSKHMS